MRGERGGDIIYLSITEPQKFYNVDGQPVVYGPQRTAIMREETRATIRSARDQMPDAYSSQELDQVTGRRMRRSGSRIRSGHFSEKKKSLIREKSTDA